ncbi:phage tail tape measure protein [Ornithobacterium rhinotracheale]|uniref:phage tail tape measure protein n=1 Tax=Ornithobacterium rhinotracheale TaxID=28251 RepID=UPI001FF6AE5C|nr:phage tail tape measure protein [Ornithobacterium rhinotracheale]MCK0206219.1 phage tail tape measure protein [Ornithobacterium rhinotracheale]
MSSNSVTYQINFSSNATGVLPKIDADLDKLKKSAGQTQKVFGDCFKALLSVNLAADGLNVLKQSFDNIIQPGVSLNSQMAELSAITGVTGEGLKAIEQAARDTSKTFGTDASANVESYKLVLSQLDPEIAKNAEAMKMMGEHINVLSKQMGGDSVAATNVLTTSMNQFGVSTENPIEAAKTMGEMMNVMSAAAQAGSAELPQIQQALEQVGMVAKTTGLSFEETNAQIQVLDKAGKKGSESGVALRNVLTTLSEGRFTSRLAAKGLQEAGISLSYLADTSIPLTERLKTLRKIQNDTALMTKVFGKENMAAAIAMINGADEAEKLTTQITGTNSAVEEAEIIMGSYAEKMARAKAWVDDLKIGFFNLIEPMAPLTQHFFSLVNALGDMSRVYISAKSAIEAFFPKLFLKTIKTEEDTIATNANTTATNRNSLAKGRMGNASLLSAIKMKSINAQMTIGAVLARIQASGIRSVAIAFGQATLGATAFQIALDALGIGLILAAIASLIYGLKHLWDNSRRFREILFGIGYAGRAVFHNIGVVLQRVWQKIIKPIFEAWWDMVSGFFTFAYEMGYGFAVSLVEFFTWIGDIFTAVFSAIWDFSVQVFTGILNICADVWAWITDTFGGFAAWVDETILEPLKNMFSKAWKWASELVDKIVGVFKKVGDWLSDTFGDIFSSDGMLSVKTEYQKGEEAGGKSFDRDKAEREKNKPQEVAIVEDKKDIFNLKPNAPTPTLGGVATDKAKKKGKAVGEKSDSGNKVQSLTVGKFMDNFNVYMNAANGIDKEQIRQAIQEVFYTAVADFTCSTN